jgi:aldehyde dehydrogenase family 7 member A1
MIWKPAPTTNLCCIAAQKIINEVLDKFGFKSVHTLCCGGIEVGSTMVNDNRIPLISFTGSTTVGQKIAVDVAKRFGRKILELGGNNAAIIMEDADLDLALKACL